MKLVRCLQPVRAIHIISDRDGHKDEAASVTAAALPPRGFFEEVETWGDTSWTPDGVQCSKSASKNKERGASTWCPSFSLISLIFLALLERWSPPGVKLVVPRLDPFKE